MGNQAQIHPTRCSYSDPRMSDPLTHIVEGILACADSMGTLPDRYYIYPEDYCSLISELLKQGYKIKSKDIPELNIVVLDVPVCPSSFNKETMQ